MPEIKRFGSFKLLMFFQDEKPPHVHIKGVDFAARVRISNGDARGRCSEQGAEAGAPVGGREPGQAVGDVG